MCREYNISESQIPSLLLFKVDSNAENTLADKPTILPLKNDNLFETIKNLLVSLEPILNYMKHCKEESQEKSNLVKSLDQALSDYVEDLK